MGDVLGTDVLCSGGRYPRGESPGENSCHLRCILEICDDYRALFLFYLVFHREKNVRWAEPSQCSRSCYIPGQLGPCSVLAGIFNRKTRPFSAGGGWPTDITKSSYPGHVINLIVVLLHAELLQSGRLGLLCILWLPTPRPYDGTGGFPQITWLNESGMKMATKTTQNKDFICWCLPDNQHPEDI